MGNTADSLKLLEDAKIEYLDTKGRQVIYQATSREHADALLQATADVFESNCQPYMKRIRFEENTIK